MHEMNHNSEAKNCMCMSNFQGWYKVEYFQTQGVVLQQVFVDPITTLCAKELHVYALGT